MMPHVVQSFIDKGIGKIISRKLMVWVSATVLMYMGNLDSGDWVVISGLYLGSQSIIDAIVKMKGMNR